MDNLQLEHILRIADTIENNGGWRIAAIHIRALVEEYRELRDSPQKRADHFYEPVDEAARAKTLRVIANTVPQKGSTFFCQNAGYICECCGQHKYKHSPTLECMVPQKGHCACGFTGGDVAHLCHVPQKGVDQ